MRLVPETFQPIRPDDPLEERVRLRAANRRLFREMVRGEVQERPLSWTRRRALVKFAMTLGIDDFEARLLIRAVEYDSGGTETGAMLSANSAASLEFLAKPAERPTWFNAGGVVLIAVLANLVFLWFVR